MRISVRGFSRRGFRVSNNQRINYAKSAIVDLTSYPEARLLLAHQGDYYTEVPTRLDLTVDGEVAVGQVGSVLAPLTGEVTGLILTAGTAPVGDDLTVEVRRGSTVLATATVNDGEHFSEEAVLATDPSVNQYERLDLYVTNIGSGTAGSDLKITVLA